MIDLSMFRDHRFAVLGLGRSGLAAARALAAGGASVIAWDDDPARRAEAADLGLPVGDLLAAVADDSPAVPEALVLSPGIPHTHPAPHPVAARMRWLGRPVIGDVELLARALPAARVIGITGTNGKSTTTALVGHLFAAAGVPAVVGGNLGPPVLGLDPPPPDGWLVLELSSYQLELTFSLACAVAVLLNVTPDHLDRHGGLDGYIHAKTLIFRAAPGVPQTAVVGVDDPPSRAIADRLAGDGAFRVVRVSVTQITADGVPAAGVYVRDGRLVDATGVEPVVVGDLTGAANLPGAHNRQNAAAAYAAAVAAGIAPKSAAAALLTFPGLAHRQQTVAVIDGVRFVNDSKATNADAAATALASHRDIYWILGGRAKVGGLDGLEDRLGAVRRAFVIGEAATDFARWLVGRVPVEIAGTLERAVRIAAAAARTDRAAGAAPNATVLLSPACASFDQFASFEARGQAFIDAVAALAAAPADPTEDAP